MKKRMKPILSFAMAIIMALAISNPVMAKESNTQDKNGNTVADMQATGGLSSCVKFGNTIYYTINFEPCEGIYALGKNKTKSTRILKKHGGFTDLSHYGKWMYFIWDKDGGGNGCSITSNSWLCKVNLNGTGFEQICRASSCMIRDDILYYQKCKYGIDPYNGCLSDVEIGKIGKIDLRTGQKSLLPGSNKYLVALEKNKIYYYSYDKSENTSIVYSMNENCKNKKKLFMQKDPWRWDPKIIYNNSLYWIDNNTLYRFYLSSGKVDNLCSVNESYVDIVDIKDGKVYILDSKKLYSVSIKSGKKKYIFTTNGYECDIQDNYILYTKGIMRKSVPYQGLFCYNRKVKKTVKLQHWYIQ